MATNPLRGEIYQVEWHPPRGSEQGGSRPSLVIQTDRANQNPHYPNTIVVTISRTGRAVPTHVQFKADKSNGLAVDCYAKCEQILTISKDRLTKRYGKVSDRDMHAVDEALKLTLDPSHRLDSAGYPIASRSCAAQSPSPSASDWLCASDPDNAPRCGSGGVDDAPFTVFQTIAFSLSAGGRCRGGQNPCAEMRVRAQSAGPTCADVRA